MEGINTRALLILPFGILGALGTVFFIWSGKGYSRTELVPAIEIAGSLIIITAFAALAARKMNPRETTIGKTMAFSYLATMVLVATFGFAYKDPFVLIALLFAPIFASPTIIPFSFFWSEFLHPLDQEENKQA